MSRKPKGHHVVEIHLKSQVQPRSENQSAYLESMQRNTFTFGVGLAGTGKTFLAAWQAMLELLSADNKIRRIVVVRPVISNKFGESIGALPGSIAEKMLPYGSSVLDNLNAFLDRDAIFKLIEEGTIEFIPLTLLRGRSLNNAFVIVEEAQNIKRSSKGVYMVMSRLGAHSKMVFNGDLGQSDLVDDESALLEAVQILRQPPLVRGIGIVELYDRRDVQRHPLLYEIMEKFNESDDNPF
ncbi:MAG: PhoH family protein [Candidatus Thorarchaeota archaeon]